MKIQGVPVLACLEAGAGGWCGAERSGGAGCVRLVMWSLLGVQRALVAAVEDHRRDLVAEFMAAYDRQAKHMATGMPPGTKPMWALDEGTLQRVLDAAAAGGDVATAQLVWRYLHFALLPQSERTRAKP